MLLKPPFGKREVADLMLGRLEIGTVLVVRRGTRV
jgi:hypothetical protein